jgi:hypothetical protein
MSGLQQESASVAGNRRLTFHVTYAIMAAVYRFFLGAA